MSLRRWPLLAPVLLIGALAVLATLQYRWLGAVSRAERDQLERGLRLRASAFAAEFDRDVTALFAAYQLDASALESDAAGTLAAALDRADDSVVSRAIRDVFLAEEGPDTHRLRRFDPGTRTLVEAPWPDALDRVRRRVMDASAEPVLPNLPVPPAFIGSAVDTSAPALIVPVVVVAPLPATADAQTPVRVAAPLVRTHRAVIVWLDRERLRQEVFAPLYERHFGDGASAEYVAAIRPREAGEPAVYSSDVSLPVSADNADLAVDIFRIRFDDVRWTRALPGTDRNPGRGRLSITIIRRGGPERAAPDRDHDPAWRLLVRARGGSLDAVVRRSRLRNMGISAGILALLGTSVLLAMAASVRQQRLARQQIAFVASVSHELRTPLAVIRSAAENLADGVVSGPQVAEYGALIRTEGRRLSDMVERVMDFAGMTAGPVTRAMEEVSPADIVHAAVQGLEREAQERQQRIRVAADGRTADGSTPLVMADADALRSALQNAMSNALKYSPPGSEVEVRVDSERDRVRITVLDRGMGIDAADLPHVFAPFFRGRRAVASQVRGSGIGLSLVEKVMQAHGGRATVTARDGGGTIVTMELPAIGGPAA